MIVYHVTPHKTRGWAIRKAGVMRTRRYADHKEDAVNIAKQLGAEKIYVHDNTGRIVDRLE